MTDFFILAQADSETSTLAKLIPFIFVLIWVISGIVGSFSKKKRQEEAARQVEEAMRNPPVDFDTDLNLPPRRERTASEPPPVQRDWNAERERLRDLAGPKPGETSEQRRGTRRDMPPKAPRVPTGSRADESASRRAAESERRDRATAAGRQQNETRRRQQNQEKIARAEKATRELRRMTRPEQPTGAPSEGRADADKFARAATIAPMSSIDSIDALGKRRSTSTNASASTVSRWLNPGTLRSQFILTEVFQPPITLRPPRELL